MEKYNVYDCSIIELDKHHSDRKGNLSVVENGETLPLMSKESIIFMMYLEEKPEGLMRIKNYLS